MEVADSSPPVRASVGESTAADPGDEVRDRHSAGHRRGYVVRRALLVADLSGLVAAFVLSELVTGRVSWGDVDPRVVKLFVIFVASLPVWVVAAKVYGLYDRDEERTEHTTVDDLVGVFHLVTVGVWVLFAGAWATGVTTPQIRNTTAFWLLAVILITSFRAAARTLVRRSAAYVQRALVVGGGDVGQLICRKVLHHPEYGIEIVGIADDQPRELRADLAKIKVYGLDEIEELVDRFRVDRVVVAFAAASEARLLDVLRRLRDRSIQVDLVPRLYEIMPPDVDVHAVEGLPLLGIRQAGMSRSSRMIKRGLDLVLASTLLVLTAPLFAVFAVLVKRDSPGPVLFRQERLGEGQRAFTAFKFRTMKVGDNDAVHREYISSIMDPGAMATGTGMYKLERPDTITRSGRWLRRTSLDELPQLLNVVRGDMSLVGPRPCLRYETELFEPHHFERFLVPAGITGLWQVTARARSTFSEALDMDVAYARGWSLGLDVWILLRTPGQVLRQRGAA
jgi:exopolysaccharide biosynthesis polyprenyl glycosylphosphotransferase